jgi:hypothetical protein
MDDFLKPPLEYISFAWASVTVVWLLLLGYRGVMANKEDDQLYLAKGEEHMLVEQQVLVGRLAKMSKPLWVLGILSGLLLVAMIGFWLWQGMQPNNL